MLIAEALQFWNIRLYESWVIYRNLNICDRWFHLIRPRKDGVVFLGPNLKSAVTYIRILIYYSTFVQTNVSQLQSYRDQLYASFANSFLYSSEASNLHRLSVCCKSYLLDRLYASFENSGIHKNSFILSRSRASSTILRSTSLNTTPHLDYVVDVETVRTCGNCVIHLEIV